MRIERIKQLERFYQEDPGDPFNAYALALEYRAVDTEKTRQLFNFLLDRHPDYLPTYYAAATFFVDAGDADRSMRIFENGMELAGKQGDAKALRELRSAYEENFEM